MGFILFKCMPFICVATIFFMLFSSCSGYASYWSFEQDKNESSRCLYYKDIKLETVAFQKIHTRTS